MHRYEQTITELAVAGNPIAEVDLQAYHWFTGRMVHGVRLRDGIAQWYRDRWIRTPAVVRRLGELVLDVVRRPSMVVTDLHGTQRGFEPLAQSADAP